MAQLAELRAREAEVKKARAEFWPKLSVKATSATSIGATSTPDRPAGKTMRPTTWSAVPC
ncbi:hypothetical protein [Methylomonas koyamae]|uniref:hypothetical protein n=1 Tax=Methylomonas koyamae TaxID=702114 RepID=UPI000B28866C|nr:hypothetical protein [Methylomonas koyamae]